VSDPWQGQGKDFLFAPVSRLFLRPTQPPIQWVPGALSLGIKQPDCEAGHSLLFNVEVKNTWSYISTPLICLQGAALYKTDTSS